MDVDEKGKRRVSWDSKRGSKNFKWVARACTELCKCKLGLGHNKLVAQQKISNSSLGPSTTSLNTYEIRECSKDSVGPILSTYSLEKFGESPFGVFDELYGAGIGGGMFCDATEGMG